ncbi:glycosyltransferase [uncultured Paraglaciecola sp.]|uniref:glycosyltransferase n=1 Tax=uncultured Paraglaciecola sp. TaxID=1765024 RepID=UPI0030D9E9DE|tara:strand:- start:75212 stop:76225 length:1014 start_codon:yes stop_codon:yes gene_type:complete
MLYELKENSLNALSYLTKRIRHSSNTQPLSIEFVCGFHGKSGGPIAIASIANGLAKVFNVNFVLTATSFYARLLSSEIKFTRNIDFSKDVYIVDLSADENVVRQIKAHNKLIILTIHGLRNALHKLNNEHIDNMLSLADKVHFVGQVQQDSYQLTADSFFIIPNSAQAVNKSKTTSNIGVVGNLDEPRKNAATSVEIGLRSDCEKIHLWSTSKQFSGDPRVIHHSWENDKEKIFDSFDVLVFLSQQETFGLVIAEALSAGIPCVLSNIDAFIPFQPCPGVVLIEESEQANAHSLINQLMLEKENLRPQIQTFFNQHFSQSIVNQQWHEKVIELSEAK